MKILAVYSSKGGVGKTATAVNLAYTASASGVKTLLCDMDSQGAASYYFRIKAKKKFDSEKLLEGKLSKYIRESDYERLDLLPAHFSFRNLDLVLAQQKAKERRHTLVTLFTPLDLDYQLLLLDCPPNLTLLSENIILAADIVVTPVVPTTLSLLALEQLLRLYKKLNADTKAIHAFFSMVEARKTMHRTVMEKYQHFSIFQRNNIPFLADIEKMGLRRQPVAVSEPGSLAAQKYYQLWLEIWEKANR